MKLPQIKYTKSVEGSLGREDIYAPLRQSKAVGDALKSVTSAAQEMYTRHIELRGQSMDLATQKAEGEIQAELKPRQHFSSLKVQLLHHPPFPSR